MQFFAQISFPLKVCPYLELAKNKNCFKMNIALTKKNGVQKVFIYTQKKEF